MLEENVAVFSKFDRLPDKSFSVAIVLRGIKLLLAAHQTEFWSDFFAQLLRESRRLERLELF